MKIQPFTGSFTQQEAISDTAIKAAVDVLRTGRLHRYNTNHGDEISHTAKLEREYADYQQSTYCLACASGGYAMSIALQAAGILPGEMPFSPIRSRWPLCQVPLSMPVASRFLWRLRKILCSTFTT